MYTSIFFPIHTDPYEVKIDMDTKTDELFKLFGGQITIVGQIDGKIPIVFVANASLQEIKDDRILNRRIPKRFDSTYGPVMAIKMKAGIPYGLEMNEYKLREIRNSLV